MLLLTFIAKSYGKCLSLITAIYISCEVCSKTIQFCYVYLSLHLKSTPFIIFLYKCLNSWMSHRSMWPYLHYQRTKSSFIVPFSSCFTLVLSVIYSYIICYHTVIMVIGCSVGTKQKILITLMFHCLFHPYNTVYVMMTTIKWNSE